MPGIDEKFSLKLDNSNFRNVLETVASTYYLRVVGAKYSSSIVLPRIVGENVRHVLQLTFLSTDCRFAMEMASQDMVSCSILVYICIDYRSYMTRT